MSKTFSVVVSGVDTVNSIGLSASDGFVSTFQRNIVNIRKVAALHIAIRFDSQVTSTAPSEGYQLLSFDIFPILLDMKYHLILALFISKNWTILIDM